MSQKTLEFFFDVASAYSYLATSQIAPLCQKTGAQVRWRPFLLGAVFKDTGNDMPARIPAKAAWLFGDVALWAKQYHMQFQLPSRFPINSLKAQRFLIAAGRLFGEGAIPTLAMPLFGAAWVDDRDMTDPEELRKIANHAGFDGDALVAAIDAPETKAALKANTDEAVARGAFGAPTFFVEEKLFWGNDRLHFVEDALR
jgi:2-hydroxychromene-2-carboxylate isomerase